MRRESGAQGRGHVGCMGARRPWPHRKKGMALSGESSLHLGNYKLSIELGIKVQKIYPMSSKQKAELSLLPWLRSTVLYTKSLRTRCLSPMWRKAPRGFHWPARLVHVLLGKSWHLSSLWVFVENWQEAAAAPRGWWNGGALLTAGDLCGQPKIGKKQT